QTVRATALPTPMLGTQRSRSRSQFRMEPTLKSSGARCAVTARVARRARSGRRSITWPSGLDMDRPRSGFKRTDASHAARAKLKVISRREGLDPAVIKLVDALARAHAREDHEQEGTRHPSPSPPIS